MARRREPLDFIDRITVQLGDATSRAAVFDDVALEQIVSTMYDADALAIEGPYVPIFEEVEVGLALPHLATIDGGWSALGGTDRSEAQLHIAGLDSGNTLRVDALWRGSITARAVPLGDPITAVGFSWASVSGVDDDIVADLGALPDDPDALEAERRQRLMASLAATMDQPDALTETAFDQFLTSIGAGSAGEALARYNAGSATGGVQVTFAPPLGAPPAPVSLPVVVALLVRDQPLAVADLLAESRRVRERLDRMWVARPPEATLPTRLPVAVTWVVPSTVFDDADWPGAEGVADPADARALRRTAAGSWLADAGIGLVTVDAA